MDLSYVFPATEPLAPFLPSKALSPSTLPSPMLQGEVIDSIEAHVESAAVHVEEGNVHLGDAEQYQRKARKKLCFLVGVGVVAAIILFLAIYFSVKSD